MQRRSFLGAAAAMAAAPSIVQAQANRVLKVIPHANLTVMDPVWTTAYITRNHGYAVWDTLYGLDDEYKPQPQMVEGHTVSNDGKLWTFTLREGLRFHNGEPVRSQDCIASLARWGKRDAMGTRLIALTEEMRALDDKRFTIRLSRPFGLMLDALAKPTSNAPFIMPASIAATDAFTQFRADQVIGSGPFSFKASELISGSRVVYEKFAGYVPRPQGTPSGTAGPKVVHFDRVEWQIIPDVATAASAMVSGEIDWWEVATPDLVPLLRRNRGVNVMVPDPLGSIAVMRPNHLHAPMNNLKFRQALVRAVSQADFMTAYMGPDQQFWKSGVGAFTPGTPLASTAGLEAFENNIDTAKRLIAESGYAGERIVLLGTTDIASLAAWSQVSADMFRRLGVNIDFQSMDWGTVVQRRAQQTPIEAGGWSAFCTNWGGLDHLNPAGHLMLRGQGRQGFIGWPESQRLESLREAWFDAPDLAAQQRIAADMQRQMFEDVPYIPLGQFFQPLAHRRNLTGVMQPGGIPVFWNVRRT